MNKFKTILFILIVSFLLYGLGVFIQKKNLFSRLYYFFLNKKTVEDVVLQLEKKVDLEFENIFSKYNANYPPDNLTLLGFKEERILEVWSVISGKPVLIKKYPFTTTSGEMGPKLIRGDGQIPEGFYKIESLNPNSAFHLSLKINYPNEFDLSKAKEESRLDPGDNIFIHGKNQSIGCVAIGDWAIEELFVLAAKTPRNKLDVILFPYDMRTKKHKECKNCPSWTKDLYDKLKLASKEFVE